MKRVSVYTTMLTALVLGAAMLPALGETWQAEALPSLAQMVQDPAAGGGQALAISDQTEEVYLLKDCPLSLPQPGKYLLQFTMKVEHAGHLGTPLVCEAFQGAERVGWAVWFGADFTADGEYQELTVPIEARSPEPLHVTLGWAPAHNSRYYLHQYLGLAGGGPPTVSLARGDLGQVYLDRVALQPVSLTAGVSAVKCQYVHLRPGERQKSTVVVTNYQPRKQTVTLDLAVITKLDQVRKLHSWALELPAQNSRTVEYSWSVDEEEFGRQVMATLRQGEQVLDEVAEYFGVSDNVWLVGNSGSHGGYNEPDRPEHVNYCLPNPAEPVVHYLHWSALCTPELIERYFQNAEGTYVNVIEKFSGAPDQFSDMTPETETWRSGQGSYYESKSMLREIIRQAHERGVKVTTYGYGIGGGPPAYEFARQHPELMAYRADGRLWSSHFNTKWFEDWPDQGYGVWPRINPNFANPEVLDTAIREVIGSIDMFGWDGIRYDSHPYMVWATLSDLHGNLVPPRGTDIDALSAANIRSTKERVHAVHPDFVFGYNWGPLYAHEDRRGVRFPQSYAACLADGGMRLNEQVIMAFQPERPGHRWEEYASLYAQDATHTISLGGHYWIMRLLLRNRMDVLHQAALSLAARCHLYNSNLGPTAFGDLAQFLTRYSYFLWDPALEPVAEPDQLFTVEADRPPIWQPFVYRRQTPEGSQIIMHLVNTPVFEEVGANTEELVPPPVAVTIRLRDPALTERLTRISLLSPESPAQPQQLEATEGALQVSDLRLWKVLVFDYSDSS